MHANDPSETQISLIIGSSVDQDTFDSFTIQQLSVFGLGKLGLPLAALFAQNGLRTVGIDVDIALVEKLRTGKIPLLEPGLEALLAAAAPKINYTTDARAAADTDASIIVVSTPYDSSRAALSSTSVEEACSELCAALRERTPWRYHLVIISSTVLPGAMSTRIIPALEKGFGRRAGAEFGIAYVPEFAALGEVVSGLQRPPFLLIGSDDARAGARAAALYGRIVGDRTPPRFLSIQDAELTKIALNVFLCLKISFGNLLAQFGDRLGGADLDIIANTLALDPRIGSGLLRGGIPYGGPCLPRDVDSFLHLSRALALDAPLARALPDVNNAQYDLIERHVLACQPRCVAVLGLSFKPGTAVTTASPAFEFVRRLQARLIEIVVFDPISEAREAAIATFGSTISSCDTLDESLRRADVILICNPDPDFVAISAAIPADRHIVDPWGCVQGPHPGLKRPGRLPVHKARGDQPQLIPTSSAVR
jgi:UDPglucose 6-dehydrogenase